MNVYVLIDRGSFIGAFSTAQKAMQHFTTTMKLRNIAIEWHETDPHTWSVKQECRVGLVIVHEEPVR